MKTLIKRSAIALAVSTVFISSASFADQPSAEDLVGRAYGGIYYNHIALDTKRYLTDNPQSNLNNGDGFGGELGYRLSETTEFRVGYTHINLDAKRDGFEEPSASNIAFDVLYFPNKQNFYWVAGVSALDVVESEVSTNLGLGFRHYTSEKTALYFETKAHYQFQEYHDDYSAQIGFTYFFGDSKNASSAGANSSMNDSDKDGVSNAKDLCANTALNASVDGYGCSIAQIDSDKDGIFGDLDKCDNTPMGSTVDASGCAIADADKDGIADAIDQCNNTPAGDTVNALGCSVADADADGIPDSVDQCNNTSVNDNVDASGCSLSDTDNDGVFNDVDQCNDTAANEKVNASGCTAFSASAPSLNLSINFANNSSLVSSQYNEKVNEVAAFMKANNAVEVIIEGHASAPGDAYFNKVLSQSRADAVVEMLINKHGIKASRLSAIGYGEERLLNPAQTRAANIENRRIVATIKR